MRAGRRSGLPRPCTMLSIVALDGLSLRRPTIRARDQRASHSVHMPLKGPTFASHKVRATRPCSCATAAQRGCLSLHARAAGMRPARPEAAFWALYTGWGRGAPAWFTLLSLCCSGCWWRSSSRPRNLAYLRIREVVPCVLSTNRPPERRGNGIGPASLLSALSLLPFVPSQHGARASPPRR